MKPIIEQTILVTGSTDGIGKLTALKLAKEKGHVLIHGRDENKVKSTVDELKSSSQNASIEGYTADFSALAEVKKLGEEILVNHPDLDVLINNAGAGYADPRHSRDGFELRFAVNYMAPFLLTHTLLPALKKAAPSRIVNVSSVGQNTINFNDVMLENNFNASKAYSQSKLALIMFTVDLAGRLNDEKITVNSLHPGTYLNTNMVRRSGITPWGEPESGAEAVFFLAESETLEGVTGKYFNITTEAKADPQVYDKEARKELWNLTLRLINEKLPAK